MLDSPGDCPGASPLARLVGEAGYAAACAAAAAGVAELDVGGRVVAVTDGLCDVLGRSRAELTGRSMSELAHPDDAASQQIAFAQVAAGKCERHSAETRYLRPDGSVVWVSPPAG